MYSRAYDGRDGETRIPQNYGGSVFLRRDRGTHFTPDGRPPKPKEPTAEPTRVAPEEASAESTPPPTPEPPQAQQSEQLHETNEMPERIQKTERDKKLSILSPIGELGTEELLLIALALIIFQSGKEPELALILLALLFIG